MSERGPEKNNSINEVYASLEDEFEQYERSQMVGLEKEYRELIEMGVMQENELEPQLEKKRLELSNMNLYQRISVLLNNFYLWWPGGWYRQILEERETKHDKDTQKLIADRQLIADLDELIHRAGYDSVAENIAKRENIDNNVRLKILADIYINMRKKGYDRLKLIR